MATLIRRPEAALQFLCWVCKDADLTSHFLSNPNLATKNTTLCGESRSSSSSIVLIVRQPLSLESSCSRNPATPFVPAFAFVAGRTEGPTHSPLLLLPPIPPHFHRSAAARCLHLLFPPQIYVCIECSQNGVNKFQAFCFVINSSKFGA